MNIIFNINNQDYQLKSGTGDILLARHNGLKKNGKGEEVESTKHVGSFKNSFEALEYIVRDQEHDNEISSLIELKQMYINTMSDVRNIAKQLKIEG